MDRKEANSVDEDGFFEMQCSAACVFEGSLNICDKNGRLEKRDTIVCETAVYAYGSAGYIK